MKALILLPFIILYSTSTTISQNSDLWREFIFNSENIRYNFAFQNLDGSFTGLTSTNSFPDSVKYLISKNFLNTIDTTMLGEYNYIISEHGLNSSGSIFGCTTDNRLLETFDKGLHWKLITDFPKEYGIQGGGIESMTLAPNGVMYMLFNLGAVFRSTDKGKTWNQLDSPGGDGFNGWIKTTSNGDVYLGTYYPAQPNNFKVFRSTDFGTTWNRFDTLLPLHSYNRNSPYYQIWNYAGIRLYEVQNQLYLMYNVEDKSFSISLRNQNFRLFRYNSQGDFYKFDAVSDDDFAVKDIYTDIHGKWHAQFGYVTLPKPGITGGYGYSLDSGKTWKVQTTTRDEKLPFRDSIDQFGDTLQTLYTKGRDNLRLLPNGHFLYETSYNGYNLSNFRIPIAPMALGIERACNSYSVTFVSDTLVSIDVTADPLFIARVDFDTLRKGVSTRVVVTSSNPDTTIHFTITAKGAMGTRVFTDSLVKHYKPTFTVKNKVIEIDAGERACYRWFRNDSIIRTELLPSITMTTAGDYWCDVFDSTSCSHQKVGFTHYVPTSITYNDVVNSFFTVYPNPAKENITIAYNTELTGTVEITDVLGNVVLVSDAKDRISTGMMTIDIAVLPNGVFGVRLPTSHGVYQTRFVVSR